MEEYLNIEKPFGGDLRHQSNIPCCSVKAHCHMQFRPAFSALLRIFPIAVRFSTTLIEPPNVITRKTLRNVENAWVNGMWQLGFITPSGKNKI